MCIDWSALRAQMSDSKGPKRRGAYDDRFSGRNREGAWHRLIDAGAQVIPSIVRALQAEAHPEIKMEPIRVLTRI